MHTPGQTANSSRFHRYAAASAVALGATAVAQAQFVDDYSLTTGTGNTGAWNQSSSGAVVDLGGAPDQINFFGSSTSPINAGLFLAAPVAGNTVVSFDWAAGNSSSYGSDSMAAYFFDGASYQTLWNYSTDGQSASGRATFLVSAGSTFGFQLNVNYSHGTGSLNISNFAAAAPIPEAGTTGLLAGCAALGFVAVLGTRERRRRAKVATAA